MTKIIKGLQFSEQVENQSYDVHLSSLSHSSNQYVSIASCVFSYICKAASLSNLEKLYYLYVDCESIANLAKYGKRRVAFRAEKWASKMGGCSKAQIFKLQKSLESKGYLKIIRTTNKSNQNNPNLLFTSLPDLVLQELALTPNRLEQETYIPDCDYDYGNDNNNHRAMLDYNKVTMQFDFELFKKILAYKNIYHLSKLFCIDYYSPCYLPNIKINKSFDKEYQISFVYQDLAERYNTSKKQISKILTKLNHLSWLHKARVAKSVNPTIWVAYWDLPRLQGLSLESS